MRHQKSLAMMAILNSVNTVLGMLFPLITYPYVTRVLGAENLGKVNFGSSIISYFAIVAALGVYTYSVREGAIYRENRDQFNKFSSEVFSINVASTIIAYFVLAISIVFISKLHQYTILILIQSISMFFTTIGVSWIYVIYEDYIYIVIRNISFQILSLVLLFILVKSRNDYILYAIITTISGGGSNIFNLIHSKKYVDLKLRFSKDCFKHIKSILYMFASTVASTIYVNSDNIILGFMWGDTPVGLYSISVKIYSILKSLVNAIYGVALPRISLQFSKKMNNEAKKIVDFVTEFTIFLIVPMFIGINILCDEIILFVGGNEYLNATLSLRILTIAFVFSIFASLYSTLILLPHKQEKIIMIASFISGLINIILNLYFIKIWKQNGAAFTTVISELIVFIIFLKKSKKFLEIKINYIELIKVVIAAICMIPISIMIKKNISNIYIEAIVNLCVCFITYVVCLIILQSQTIKRIWNKLRNKLMER